MYLFWDSWDDKFLSSVGKYITPNTNAVESFAEEVPAPEDATEDQVAKEIWLHITNNINYKLEEEWLSPGELLDRRSGDCEDMVFLFLSVAPNLGIDEAEMHIGYLVKEPGSRGPHVWAEVNGNIIDPTGYPSDVEGLEYNTIEKYEVKYDG